MISNFDQGPKVLTWLLIFNNDDTKDLIRPSHDEKFAPFSDYDAIAQITFSKIEHFLAYGQDPYFLEVIMPDHLNFAEVGKTTYVQSY